MRTVTIFALGYAALTLAAAAPAVAADAIDCRRDHNTAERTICASRQLRRLDAEVTETYNAFMRDSRLSSSSKAAVYDSQRDFLARRDQCGRDTECLSELMQRRATRINYYR